MNKIKMYKQKEMRDMPRNQPKLKLIAAVGFFLILGFLVTSISSFMVSRESLRGEILHNELPLTSDNIYSEIQRDLLRPIFISSLMANDTFLRDWVISGEQGEEQITRYLKEIQDKYKMFTSFFVSEKTRNYYHAGKLLKKVSPDSERDEWYFRVRDLKADYEINVDPDLANKDAMTIFINYRVFDYEKKYIGAIGVGLTVSAVKELIEIYQKKYNRVIYFVDSKGEIKIAGSQFDKSISNISKFNYFSELKPSLENKKDKTFTYEKNGQVIHTNARFIEEFGWHLIVEQSEQRVLQQISATLVTNLAICVLITAIILFLVNFSVNRYQESIETLRGILPICSFCKQIRDDKGYWNRVESFVSEHTEVQFSHSICPSCIEKNYPEEYESMKEKGEC
jgi:hypothetical protein